MNPRTARPTFRLAVAAGAVACWLATASDAHAAGDFVAEANRIAQSQLKKLGKGYTAKIDPTRHIVYISALDDAHLRKTIALLSAFTDAYRRTLPAAKPAWNITVVLPTADDYRTFSPPFAGCIGFYSPAGRRLVAIDRGRTLVHEFTHALHHADTAAARQVHPIWVCEGLATLFEASRITPSGLKPQLDRRLPTVQRALRSNKAIPLQRLLTMGREAFLADAAVAYAQARYVMYYLHERGRLDDWYRRYKNTFSKDPTGLKAFEAALTSRIFLIEPAWKKWVLSLRTPSSEYRTGQGRLGLEVRKSTQGVKVVGTVPGSAARTAGRIRVGDVIKTFNNTPIAGPAQLGAAVRAAGALKTVHVQLLRHGRQMTVLQPLGAPGSH